VGALGEDPVEAEMFDVDGYGNVQVALLPQEQLHIPFSFLSMNPALASTAAAPSRKGMDADADAEARTVEVKIISGTHGLVVAVLNVHIHPRDFVIHRMLRYFEPENSVMKRKLTLINYAKRLEQQMGSGSGASTMFVHVVENNHASDGGGNKVVVEWGSHGPGSGSGAGAGAGAGAGGGRGLASDSGVPGAVDMAMRFRCGAFPSVGSFYVLLYEDRYQAKLLEVQ
jgi:hypothetical protein